MEKGVRIHKNESIKEADLIFYILCDYKCGPVGIALIANGGGFKISLIQIFLKTPYILLKNRSQGSLPSGSGQVFMTSFISIRVDKV